MKTERFAYENEARDFAAKWSRKNKTTLELVISPHEDFPTKRIVVGEPCMIRSWETLVATYENGKEV